MRHSNLCILHPFAESRATRQPFSTETHPKIYTKTGDKGTSSLFSGERTSKSSTYFAALGDVDELNGMLGVVREYAEQLRSTMARGEESAVRHSNEQRTADEEDHAKEDAAKDRDVTQNAKVHLDAILAHLPQIQSRLLDCGSSLATPPSSSPESYLALVKFAPEHISQLEEWIDAWEEKLPALRRFILPSGGVTASHLHVARSIARRAERSIVALRETGDLDEDVMRYMNRLSDYLFVAARVMARCEAKEEVSYKKQRERKNRRRRLDEQPKSAL